MGFFSRLFGSSKNNDQGSNAQASNAARALHTSITRALAGVVYYNSTVGALARIIGNEQFGQQLEKIVEQLYLALAIGGATTKETLSDLIKTKVQRFSESKLDPDDLQPCVLCFLYIAIEDAKKLCVGKEVEDLLISALNKFGELTADEEDYPSIALAVKNKSSKYRELANYIDTGRKSGDESDSAHSAHSQNLEGNSEPSFDARLDNSSRHNTETFNGPDLSSKKATPLFSAALNHDYDSVCSALSDGADPNMRSFANYRINSLVSESEPGVPDRVLYILRKQAIDKKRWPQLFYKPELGFTSLYFPALDGDIITTRLLLEAGADPNAISFNGMFPLYLAAEGGHIEVVKDLVEHGANVNQTTPKGCTSLLNAAEEGKGDVVVYLLAHGANPHIESEFGATPLSGAEQYGHNELATLLLSYSLFGETPDPPFNHNLYSWSHDVMGQDVSKRISSSIIAQMVIDELNETYFAHSKEPHQALVTAIANQNLEALAKAIESGCDVNRKYVHAGKRITPIVEAAVMDNQEMVEMLIGAGADVNISQDNGETALMNASQNGNYHIVSELLDAGANPNAVSHAGSALAVADNIGVMYRLIESGADVDLCDANGNTPIVGCIQTRAYEACYFLRAAGADINKKNKQGETPLDIAIALNDDQMTRALTADYYVPEARPINIDSIRDVILDRIAKMRNDEFPPSYYLDESVYQKGAIIDRSRLDARNHAISIAREALDFKRKRNLKRSNELYIEAFNASDYFYTDGYWGWAQTLLLAKNFPDARLIMRMFSAQLASINRCLHTEKEENFIAFDFDGFSFFQKFTHAYPMSKQEVERKIISFGGQRELSNRKNWEGFYSLRTNEYDSFLRCFGVDDFYTAERLLRLTDKNDTGRREDLLQKLIDNGDERKATYELALLYFDSDQEKATTLFERAINAGDDYYATYSLGQLVKKDNPKLAQRLFEKSLEAGCTIDAAKRLAELVESNDPERAISLYQTAIDAGDIDACSKLARLVYKDDRERAIELCEKAVAAGDTDDGAFVLGWLHEKDSPEKAKGFYQLCINNKNCLYNAPNNLGLLVQDDNPERAKKLFQMSIDAGNHLAAARNLANLVRESDPERAKELYQMAVDVGDESSSAFKLACLVEGEDPEQAEKLYAKSINAGNSNARPKLARLIHKNDRQRAISLCEEAVSAGDTNDGAFFLAWLLENDNPERAKELYQLCIDNENCLDTAPNNLGFLIRKEDPERAKKLFQMSIDAGDSYYATNNLGKLIEEEDPERALALFKAAADAGNPSAGNNYIALAKRICPDEKMPDIEAIMNKYPKEDRNDFGTFFMPSNRDKAVSIFEDCIDAGDKAYAPCNLAHMIAESDPDRAESLYRLSLENETHGSATEALIGLGLLLEKSSPEEAKTFLGAARERNNLQDSIDFMVDYYDSVDSSLSERIRKTFEQSN